MAPTNLAFVYLALGDRAAKPSHCWSAGSAERDPAMLYLQVEPKLDGLRGDPRFRAIAAQDSLAVVAARWLAAPARAMLLHCRLDVAVLLVALDDLAVHRQDLDVHPPVEGVPLEPWQ